MGETPQGTNREVLETEIRRVLHPDLAEDLTKATTILLRDSPPGPVDAVFFFGRSYFDAGKQDIFTVAADFIKQNKAKYLLLVDSEGERAGETIPHVANPGKSLWTDRLVRLGVDKDRILYSPHLVPGERGFNTKTEAEAFLQTSAENGFKTAAVLTQPHQIVRAMLSVVKTIHQKGLPMDVWCMVPQSIDWNKRVKGSQGMARKPRVEHIGYEIERIFRYQAAGDIASFDELFAYLTRRDNQQLSFHT